MLAGRRTAVLRCWIWARSAISHDSLNRARLRGYDLSGAYTKAEEILASNPDGIMLSNGPGDPKECTAIIEEIKKLYAVGCSDFCDLPRTSADGAGKRRAIPIR